MEHLMGVLTGIGFVLFVFALSGVKTRMLMGENVPGYHGKLALGALVCFVIVFIYRLILVL